MPTIQLTGWHGGWGNFSTVDPDHLGTGEGEAFGRGFYFAENRKGGEYYAEYFARSEPGAYLHKVVVECDLGRCWHNAEKTVWRIEPGIGLIDFYDYHLLRSALGLKQAASFLQSAGVDVFSIDEGEKPPHGRTFVVLNFALVRVLETYEYISDRRNARFERTK